MLVCNCKESCINCVNVKCLKLTLTLWSGWTVKYDRFRDDVSPGVFKQIKPSLRDVFLFVNYFCGKAQRLTTPTSAQAPEFTQLPTQVTSSSSIVSPCSSMMNRVDKVNSANNSKMQEFIIVVLLFDASRAGSAISP